jgi:hypothetical protein
MPFDSSFAVSMLVACVWLCYMERGFCLLSCFNIYLGHMALTSEPRNYILTIVTIFLDGVLTHGAQIASDKHRTALIYLLAVSASFYETAKNVPYYLSHGIEPMLTFYVKFLIYYPSLLKLLTTEDIGLFLRLVLALVAISHLVKGIVMLEKTNRQLERIIQLRNNHTLHTQ